MVVGAADLNGLHLVVASNASENRPDGSFIFRQQPAAALFGGEDHVDVEGCKRVGHGQFMPPGRTRRKALAEAMRRYATLVLSKSNCRCRKKPTAAPSPGYAGNPSAPGRLPAR